MKKKLLAVLITIAMAVVIFSVDTHAITFVNIYSEVTAEVVNIEPARDGKFV